MGFVGTFEHKMLLSYPILLFLHFYKHSCNQKEILFIAGIRYYISILKLDSTHHLDCQNNALIFYPPKSNSKSILILIWFLEFLNYNLDSNLTNCVYPDLKPYNPWTSNLILKHYLKTMHNYGSTGCGVLSLGIHN